MSVTGGVPKVSEPNDDPKESKKNVTCEFCDCVLFADGSVKSRSVRAKKLQAADDISDSLRETNEALKLDIESRNERIKSLSEELEKKSKVPDVPPTPKAERGIFGSL
jgi:hypothetical protein